MAHADDQKVGSATGVYEYARLSVSASASAAVSSPVPPLAPVRDGRADCTQLLSLHCNYSSSQRPESQMSQMALGVSQMAMS